MCACLRMCACVCACNVCINVCVRDVYPCVCVTCVYETPDVKALMVFTKRNIYVRVCVRCVRVCVFVYGVCVWCLCVVCV